MHLIVKVAAVCGIVLETTTSVVDPDELCIIPAGE